MAVVGGKGKVGETQGLGARVTNVDFILKPMENLKQIFTQSMFSCSVHC